MRRVVLPFGDRLQAAANITIASCARTILSIVTPEGRNRGSITEAMNRTEISGTPRMSSM